MLTAKICPAKIISLKISCFSDFFIIFDTLFLPTEERIKQQMDEEDLKFKEMLEKKKEEKIQNEKKRLLEEEALKARKG